MVPVPKCLHWKSLGTAIFFYMGRLQMQYTFNATPSAGAKRKRNMIIDGMDAHEIKLIKQSDQIVTAKPANDARGHTGYLTFATRIVREPEELEAVQPDIEPQTAEELQV